MISDSLRGVAIQYLSIVGNGNAHQNSNIVGNAIAYVYVQKSTSNPISKDG